MTAGQQRAWAARRALTRARYDLLRSASEAGLERADAARRAGLSLAGMKTLLYRRCGSTDWPLAERGRVH